MIITRAEAQAQNLKEYNTGKPCTAGHFSRRRVSSRTCVECEKISKSQRKDKTLAEHRRWVSQNRQRRLDINKRWVKSHPEAAALNYRVKAARRRAKKINATLPGYEDKLREVYNNRPENMEVDHEFPLVSKISCGLHVPWNLQYLTPTANKEKSNKIPEGASALAFPDMKRPAS